MFSECSECLADAMYFAVLLLGLLRQSMWKTSRDPLHINLITVVKGSYQADHRYVGQLGLVINI